jgi:hypothetical protein
MTLRGSAKYSITACSAAAVLPVDCAHPLAEQENLCRTTPHPGTDTQSASSVISLSLSSPALWHLRQLQYLTHHPCLPLPVAHADTTQEVRAGRRY